MTEYRISWQIELDADTPEQAAAIALSIQRDTGSTATWFHVDGQLIQALPEEEA